MSMTLRFRTQMQHNRKTEKKCVKIWLKFHCHAHIIAPPVLTTSGKRFHDETIIYTLPNSQVTCWVVQCHKSVPNKVCLGYEQLESDFSPWAAIISPLIPSITVWYTYNLKYIIMYTCLYIIVVTGHAWVLRLLSGCHLELLNLKKTESHVTYLQNPQSCDVAKSGNNLLSGLPHTHMVLPLVYQFKHQIPKYQLCEN